MRVFTLTQLEERQIPKPMHFLRAFAGVSKGFETIYASQGETEKQIPLHLAGAVVIGSMAKRGHAGEMRCTSDIDIIAFYDDRQADDDAISAFAVTYRGRYLDALSIAVESNVPMNIYNIFLSGLETGMSRHNRQFLKHAIASLEGFGGKCRSGLIVGDRNAIMKMFEAAPMLTAEQACEYMAKKKENMRDGHFSWGGLSQEKSAKLFADMFNAPFHAARQVLDVYHVSYVDTRAGVIEAIDRTFGNVGHALSDLDFHMAEYAKECEYYRDAPFDAKRPSLNADQVYSEADRTLSVLCKLLL